MKVFILLAAVIVAVNASFSDQDRWTSFKIKHNRNYDLIEDQMRFEIFQNNLRKIEAHNEKYEKGESTYFLKETQFADWTNEESKQMLNFIPNGVQEPIKHFKFGSNYVRPSSIDWREKGAVGPVKNQNPCGACWAFATTGALEGQLRIHRNDTVLLSEQEFVDCDTSNARCAGGEMSYALTYVANNGLSSEEQYPFIRANGSSCDAVDIEEKPLQTIHGFSFIDPVEENLADGLANVGPIIVGIAVGGDFELYGGGVFDGRCGEELNHAVLGVGYADDYWIIKNSWGGYWGDNGYIKLKRGVGECRIGSYYLYPLL